MKTSSFKIYKGDMGMSIALYPPIDWVGAQYLALAPYPQLFYAIKSEKIDQAEYEKRYREDILDRLDVEKTYDRLKGYVLLCWERPGDFCHRRIVSFWVQEKLGIEVPEWKPGDDLDNIYKPLF